MNQRLTSRVIVAQLSTFLAACWLFQSFAISQEKDSEMDAPELRGQWRFIDGTRAGQPAGDENMAGGLVIDDNAFRIAAEPGVVVMTYQLDTKSDPVAIDFDIIDGPVQKSKAKGIIKVSQDKFTVCYDPTGDSRPDGFESTEDNGWHVFELARKEFDAKQLEGQWTYIFGERAGEEVDISRLEAVVSIEDGKFVVPAGPDSEFVMAFTIDSKSYPVAIDLTIESGPAPEGQALGIIDILDGQLTLCYDPTGASRPKDFSTSGENGFFMFILEPQKDSEDEDDEDDEDNDGEDD